MFEYYQNDHGNRKNNRGTFLPQELGEVMNTKNDRHGGLMVMVVRN